MIFYDKTLVQVLSVLSHKGTSCKSSQFEFRMLLGTSCRYLWLFIICSRNYNAIWGGRGGGGGGGGLIKSLLKKRKE